ncbi:hypothetical protein [Geobacillus thermodenitrificans]|nr:hypothetical protein [Geobacillus thermodenitrificans]
MKISKIFATVPLAGIVTAALIIGLGNTDSDKTDTKVSASVSVEEPIKNLTPQKAQEYVDFEVQSPNSPEGFKEPSITVILPPQNALKNVNEKRKLTRVETFYESKDNPNEGIRIIQTNTEIIPSNPSNGEPLTPSTLKVGDLEVNYYGCDCNPATKTYWWYDGKVSTHITAFGDIKEDKIVHIIKQLNKKNK